MPQDGDEIAAVLGIGDRFTLARALSGAGRAVAYALDVALRVRPVQPPARCSACCAASPQRRPLAEGVVLNGDEVTLARDVDPARTPALLLRVAAAAARTGRPIAPGALTRLGESAPEPRAPWPADVRQELVSLLGAGEGLIDVVESLDRTGLWARLFPEWGAVRDLPPRDAAHVWTVDRHLVQATANAARLVTSGGPAGPAADRRRAARHRQGPRRSDHSVVGAALATQVGERLGLPRHGRGHAVRDGPPPPAAPAHGDPPQHRGRGDRAAASSTRSAATRCCWSCCTRWPRRTRSPPGRACGRTGRPRSSPTWWPGAGRRWPAERHGDADAARRPRSARWRKPLRRRESRTSWWLAGGRSRRSPWWRRTTPACCPARPGVLALHSLKVHAAELRAHAGVGGRRVRRVAAVRLAAGHGAAAGAVRPRARRARCRWRRSWRRRNATTPTEPDDPPRPRVLWFDDEADGGAASRDVVLELRAADRLGLLHDVAGRRPGAARRGRAAGRAAHAGGRDARSRRSACASGRDPGSRRAPAGSAAADRSERAVAGRVGLAREVGSGDRSDYPRLRVRHPLRPAHLGPAEPARQGPAVRRRHRRHRARDPDRAAGGGRRAAGGAHVHREHQGAGQGRGGLRAR